MGWRRVDPDLSPARPLSLAGRVYSWLSVTVLVVMALVGAVLELAPGVLSGTEIRGTDRQAADLVGSLGELDRRGSAELGRTLARQGVEVVGVRGTEVGSDDVALILRLHNGEVTRCHRVDFRPGQSPTRGEVTCPDTPPLRFAPPGTPQLPHERPPR